MSKIFLWATVSVVALCAQARVAAERTSTTFCGDVEPGSTPKGAKLLYNQNSNGNGYGINSQNFTSGVFTSGDDAGADDFVIPDGKTWRITEVDVTGIYYNGSGPARSENVIFYKNNNGLPGRAIKKGTFTGLIGNDDDGSLAIDLPGHGLTLKPGTYWVSVVANCSFEAGCGEWGWGETNVVHGNQAVWEDPGSTGTCQTWGTLETCFGQSGDFMFDLRGIAKRD